MKNGACFVVVERLELQTWASWRKPILNSFKLLWHAPDFCACRHQGQSSARFSSLVYLSIGNWFKMQSVIVKVWKVSCTKNTDRIIKLRNEKVDVGKIYKIWTYLKKYAFIDEADFNLLCSSIVWSLLWKEAQLKVLMPNIRGVTVRIMILCLSTV
jgi:hypothetical protein